MLVVAGSSHAVNLADGMDGLAAGCVAIALAAVGVLVMQQDDPRSRVLVGDVGALGLGAALAAIGLLSHTALWLPVIGGVFVLEALSVILQVASYRWRGRRRVFRVAPLHHHFHLGGVVEPKLTVRFWVAGAVLAMLALTAVLP
jgi:phospho-N-acetylmuramoyl-pentapeptide-transferase